ncbi:MAG: trigger factor [Anaerolineales bacterium]
MNIDKEILEDQQVKLTVEVENDQLEASKRKAAKKIARRIKVPGFRPGKAPYQVIRRQIGDEALMEESLEILIQDLYPKVIEQTEIEPYGPGNLENVVSLDPLVLEFIIPLMAEVELGDYRAVRLPYEPPEVTDQEVEAVEQDFRQRQAVEETVDRPAEAGDHAYIRISAKRSEQAADDQGENGENGNESDAGALIEERSTSMIIATEQGDTSVEWPFEGFSRELIGMAAGEDKTLLYTFQDDSPYESLRGADAEFSIHMEDVKARLLPELNDEFAQSLGEYEDLEALQRDIRESLEQRAIEAYNTEYDDQVLDQIIESSTIKYPPQMKENEIDNVIQQLENRLRNQGLDLDLYLKTRDMENQDLRDEAEPVAETRVKRSLVVLEIARLENIDVSEAELEEETSRTLDSITRFMSEADRKQFDSPNTLMNLTGSIYAEMRMNRTIEFLRKVANGEADAFEPSPDEEEPVDDAADSKDDPSQPSDIAGEPEVVQATDEQQEMLEKGSSADPGEESTEAPEHETAEVPGEHQEADDTSD